MRQFLILLSLLTINGIHCSLDAEGKFIISNVVFFLWKAKMTINIFLEILINIHDLGIYYRIEIDHHLLFLNCYGLHVYEILSSL